MGLIESMSGKVCTHSDVYFFHRNGKVFTGKMCCPYQGDPSASQTAVRTKFRTAQSNARAALADPDQRAALIAAFKTQQKYSTLWGYTFAQEYSSL